MTPKNTPDPEGDDSLGVLDDSPSSNTTGIGLVGGTAQVSVSLPTGDDDDLADDEVIDGEIVSDLIIDTSAVADDVTVARMSRDTPDIVIELPADEMPETPATDAEPVLDEPQSADASASPDEEIVLEAEPVDAEADSGSMAEVGAAQDASADESQPMDDIETAVAAAKAQLREAMSPSPSKKPAVKPAMKSTTAKSTTAKSTATKNASESASSKKASTAQADARKTAESTSTESKSTGSRPETATPASSTPMSSKAAEPKTGSAEPVAAGSQHATPTGPELTKPADARPAKAPAVGPAASAEISTSSPVQPAKGHARGPGSRPANTASVDDGAARSANTAAAARARAAASVDTASRPATHTEEERSMNDAANHDGEGSTAGSAPAHTGLDVVLTAKRLDDLGEASRESADLLTADRLLDPARVSKPEPEGTWSHLLYAISGGRINIGDGRKARERKQLTARIAAPLAGTARFVPVLSRKGGVGKTTVTALLGMALADARDDRVIAVDANPDRGTLAERVVGSPGKSVRDLVRAQQSIRGFHDISALVARDETRLDVLASDADPRVAEAFGDSGYRDVAKVAGQYYSLVLTDSGTGIVHSVMSATLELADQLVIVSGLSVDEARLASETITWLETNGHAALARDAIVVLNQSTPGAPMVRLSELEAHFSTRAKHVLRIPYDPQIAGGGAIDFASLQPQTRQAARELAAALVEGLRARAA